MIETGIETEIENRTVVVIDPLEDVRTTTMTVAMGILRIDQVGEIDHEIGAVRETEMMAGTTAAGVKRETIGAGEMIPATGHEGGGMILLTQGARLGGMIVGIVHRIRNPA